MQPRIHAPGLVSGPLDLDPDASHHLSKVLRIRQGEPLTLFDGNGHEAQAVVTAISKDLVQVLASTPVAVNRESPVEITVVQSLCTGDKMDWVIQKATELGAARIIPLSAHRSVLRLDGSRMEKRVAHWRAIAESSTAQCGRTHRPEITPVQSFTEMTHWWRHQPQPITGWCLDPFASTSLGDASINGPLVILVGPEAGWTGEEEQQAKSAGFVGIRCGPRILRTETAAAALLAAIAVKVGEF
jgi:16S rRNA (uracil1498-N3)-methyltransferase